MSQNIGSINIFPSPATEYTQVDITLTGNEKIRMMLMDAAGKTIETRTVNATAGLTSERFDVSNLAAGVYHIAVTDSKNNSFVRRIVVN